MPDSVDVGDILHLIAQMINHGPNSYIGNLQLTYTVLEIFEEGDEYPINSSYGSFWEGDFNDNLFDVDEVIDLEDNQNLVVTEENFRRGQKNIIIIWPVDLISDTNPSNNYYIKEIYVRK